MWCERKKTCVNECAAFPAVPWWFTCVCNHQYASYHTYVTNISKSSVYKYIYVYESTTTTSTNLSQPRLTNWLDDSLLVGGEMAYPGLSHTHWYHTLVLCVPAARGRRLASAQSLSLMVILLRVAMASCYPTTKLLALLLPDFKRSHRKPLLCCVMLRCVMLRPARPVATEPMAKAEFEHQ